MVNSVHPLNVAQHAFSCRGMIVRTRRNSALYAQALSAFSATTFDNQAAALSTHAFPKTVFPFSTEIAGLKSSFHTLCSLEV